MFIVVGLLIKRGKFDIIKQQIGRVKMNISDEQVVKIFELASLQDKLDKPITENDISEALIEIERKLDSFSASSLKVSALENKKILIADDLELSIYQLSTVLKKVGLNPVVARNKKEALSEIQKAHFDCIIIDLFITDSTDGFELINAAIKKKTEDNFDSKIIVISGTDDLSLIEKCYELGVDFYIQKDSSWHSKLLKYIISVYQTDTSNAFTNYFINSSINAYSVKRLNDQKVFSALMKSINSSIYSNAKNILIDLREINTFDVDNVYIFADIYKLCAENDGMLVLINPSNNVKEALAFAFLEDVIPCVNSIEQAVTLVIGEDYLQEG